MAGLSCAKGKFVAFVDSDDYVSPRYLEELYTAINENDADIACCNYYFRFETTGLTVIYPCCWKSILNRDKALQRLMRDYSIQGFLWNKLYRKSPFYRAQYSFSCHVL